MEYNKPENLFLTDALKEISSFSAVGDENGVVLDNAINERAMSSMALDANENVTVVTRSMVIDGNLVSDSNVAVNGRINGNISTTKDLGVNGLVIGDTKSNSAHFSNAKVQGNINAVDSITVKDGSIIVGNLTSDNVSIDGKVKGIISAANVANFGENSLVVGEVLTSAIHMKENARVNARITLTNKNMPDADDNEFDLGV